MIHDAITRFLRLAEGFIAVGDTIEVGAHTGGVDGILRFGDADAVPRLTARVDPSRRLDAGAELRRRSKEAVDRERIPVPFIRRAMDLREHRRKESQE